MNIRNMLPAMMALLLLAGCTNSSETASSTSESETNTQTSESSSSVATIEWSGEDVTAMEDLFGFVVPVPTGAVSYEMYYYDADPEAAGYYIDVFGLGDDGCANYASQLEGEGWEVIDYSDTVGSEYYGAVKALDEYSEAYLYLQPLVENGETLLTIGMDSEIWEYSSAWPTAESEYGQYIGFMPPAYAPEGNNGYLLRAYDDMGATLAIDVLNVPSTAEDEYVAILEATGYAVDKSLYEDYGIIANIDDNYLNFWIIDGETTGTYELYILAYPMYGI